MKEVFNGLYYVMLRSGFGLRQLNKSNDWLAREALR
jgi:hypothetical protein